MKGKFIGYVCLVLASVTPNLVSAASSCSNSSLSGAYLYYSRGIDNGTGFAESGIEHYDGLGNITGTFSSTSGQAGELSGTYVINKNCQGSVTYSDGSIYDIFVDPKGEIFTFDMVSGGTQYGMNRRVALDAAKCSNSDLKGTYIFEEGGLKNGLRMHEVGMEYFDGNGHLVGSYSDGSGEKSVTSGTYVVAENCRATVTYEDGSVEDFYLAKSGNIFSFVSKNSGSVIAGLEDRISKANLLNKR